jgi:hypothetical protein
MKRIALPTALIVAFVCVSIVVAQVSYPLPFFTSYQLVNLGNSPATITIDYYNASGQVVSGASKSFPSVGPGASVTVLQAVDDPNLGSGRFSVVVSSSQPVAAVVNQQLGQSGSTSSTPPFSSYSGAASGATSVTIPVVMHNWFGYYTDVFIQNVGSGPANVTINYAPTSIGTCTTGASGQSDTVSNLAQFASTMVSQVSKTSLGAPSAPGCTSYTNRFLGGATVTSNHPIVVVVNQNVQGKLFTYNGFTQGGTTLLAPAYMRNHFGFYASITIANLHPTQDATVNLTYRSDSTLSSPANQTVTAQRVVPAGKSITIYDGPGATADQSDLDTVYDLPSERFFGSIRLQSVNGQPIVAIVNQESRSTAGGKAGAYNAMLTSEAATKISAPLIQSAFFGYYTSLTVQTVDGGEATVNICYTSDGVYSSVKNTTKCYTHSTVNGFLNRYEGPSATAAQSDLLDDPAWLSGGQRRFLGSATVEVVSGSKIVSFVNSESNNTSADAQYTYNTFVITP